MIEFMFRYTKVVVTIGRDKNFSKRCKYGGAMRENTIIKNGRIDI